MPLPPENARNPGDPNEIENPVERAQAANGHETNADADLRNRLATAHGHLGAIRRMIEAHTPLPPVLFQLRALERSLEEISLLVIRAHLKTCLDDADADTDARLAAIEQLWSWSPGQPLVATSASAQRTTAPKATPWQPSSERGDSI